MFPAQLNTDMQIRIADLRTLLGVTWGAEGSGTDNNKWEPFTDKNISALGPLVKFILDLGSLLGKRCTFYVDYYTKGDKPQNSNKFAHQPPPTNPDPVFECDCWQWLHHRWE